MKPIRQLPVRNLKRLCRQNEWRQRPFAEKVEEQTEDAIKSLLTNILALYLLVTSRKPLSLVIDELIEAEVEAARIVHKAMPLKLPRAIITQNLRGVLCGALSLIPITQKESFSIEPPIETTVVEPKLESKAKPKKKLSSSRLQREIKMELDNFNFHERSARTLAQDVRKVGSIVGEAINRHMLKIEVELKNKESRRKK